MNKEVYLYSLDHVDIRSIDTIYRINGIATPCHDGHIRQLVFNEEDEKDE